MEPRGRIAVVTGAAAGTGRMIAQRLAAEGALVVVADVDPDGGRETAGPHVSPEYAAAKAGLIRFTASLAGLRERMNVRVNCVIPDWIATPRALDELAQLAPAERAAAPTPRPPEEIAAAVVELVREEDHAGRVMVMWPGESPRLLEQGIRL
jgi:NAD(P)-dependent dehydrogenase (short-subunit alcohol dehydrogenase family)